MNSISMLGTAVALVAIAAPANGLPANFSAKADAIVAESWPADGPGAAIVVTEGGKTVYERGRGLADIRSKRPITPATVFRMGSITKQFSAAVLMQLVAEGKLSLDDPLSKFFPDFPQPGAGATVRQLLNHTSGIQSYTDIPGWMVEEKTNKLYSTDEMIAEFKSLPSPSKPGETWAYNNSGYVLVGAIIEKITGNPWHQAIRDRIVAPLGLRTIRYGIDEASVPVMAKGFGVGDDGQPVASQKINMSVPHAAGALIGTAHDLATWGNAFHHGRIVDAASYKLMTTPTKTTDGKESPYGFGLQLDEIRGHPTIGHGGGIFGFITASTYVPEKDVFVAVFHNSAPPITTPGSVAAKLAMLAIGDPFPEFRKQPVDLKAVEPFLGVYQIDGGETERVFFERDGKLFTRRTDSNDLEVFPAGNGRFFYEGGMTWFDLNEAGGSAVMEMYQDGAKKAQIAKRTGPVPAQEEPIVVPIEKLKLYAGEYKLGSERAVITLDSDGLSVTVGPQPTFRLIPRSDSEFTVEKVGARLVFNARVGMAATSVTLHQGGRSIEAPRIQ